MSVQEAKLKVPRSMFEEQFAQFMDVGFESWVPTALQMAWNWPTAKKRPKPQAILKAMIATWLDPHDDADGRDSVMRAEASMAASNKNKVSIHDPYWDENPYFRNNPDELRELREKAKG